MSVSQAIGIDLGTTKSGVWQNDHVEIINNDYGNRTTPSYVSFVDGDCLVGDAAMSRASANSFHTVHDAKRLIGLEFDDAMAQADSYVSRFPFKVVNKNSKPYIHIERPGEQMDFSPEQISTMLLLKMKQTAESHLGKKVTQAVVSIPAQFTCSQRQATKDAVAASGMHLLRLIFDPSAAAITYHLHNRGPRPGDIERNVLIFDLGGGSLDVSLFTIEEGIIEAKATAGDPHLGGADFDNRLVDHFIQEFKHRNHGIDISWSPRAFHRLCTACERAKRTLSSATQAFIELESLYEGIDFFTSITRARFEELCNDLFLHTLEPIKTVLSNSKISKANIDEVVLIGGSTRIPRIAELVSQFCGKKSGGGINPDEAVAYGAAVRAAMLSGDTSAKIQELLLLDVVPSSIGIETAGGVMTRVLKRNNNFPTINSETFTTYADDQTSVVVQVYEGECARAKDNKLLGVLRFEGILPAPRGVPVIEVAIEMWGDGNVGISVTDRITGLRKSWRLDEIGERNGVDQIDDYGSSMLVRTAS